jgi:hypothetical protein
MNENDQTSSGDEILKELIQNSNISEGEKNELLSMNLRAIFDPLSHHYKETPESQRVRLFKSIVTSDIFFGTFLENLVIWLEEVSMGIAILNVGEAIQENIKQLI